MEDWDTENWEDIKQENYGTIYHKQTGPDEAESSISY
jgi:hypothetical protein